MNKWLRNKKGVTVLEGVIALGLLAVVTAGSFGVLLASSRQASQPDMREEMALSIEKANDKLKAMLLLGGGTDLQNLSVSSLPDSYQISSSGVYNICPEYDVWAGLQVGTWHDIMCLLPPICDRSHSTFQYQITADSSTTHGTIEDAFNTSTDGTAPALYQVEYNISCNGYQL